jgi:hypothetical protein
MHQMYECKPDPGFVSDVVQFLVQDRKCCVTTAVPFIDRLFLPAAGA